MDKLIFDLNMNLDGEKFYDEELKRTASVKELNNVKAYIERIDKDDCIYFKVRIKSDKLDYFNNLYNDAFLKETQQNKFSISQEIQKYEGLLQTNPKSRDVLIKLALLYLEQNEPRKARTYYAQAKKIDPWISISILEGIEE